MKGYYEQIIGFMRNFLSGGLKDNQDLERAFLTGILRVAKESIFSGLNKLNVNSILEDRYSSYFGFSETEVKKILHDYGMQEQFKVVKEWYNGNSYGTVHIPNKEVKTAYEKEIISKLEQLIPKGKRIIINV